MIRRLSLFLLSSLVAGLLSVVGASAAVAQGALAQGTLAAAAQQQERSLHAAESHRWDIPLTRDRFARIEIQAITGELEIGLVDPNGALLAGWALAPDEAEPLAIDWVSAEAGTWRVELTAADSPPVTSYRIGLVETRRARRRDRQLWHADRLDHEVSRALAAGDLAESRAAAERAIAAREEALAGDLNELAAYVDDLGFRFYGAPIASAEAVETTESLFRRALDLRLRGGEDALVIEENLHNLATLNFNIGRYRKAEEYQRRSLALVIDRLGEGAAEAAPARLGLAKILFRQTRYDEAAAETQRALALCGPLEASCRVEALLVESEMLRVQNRLPAAEAAALEALARAEEGLDEEWEFLLDDLHNNLAGVYKDMGRYAEAETLTRRLLARFEGDPEVFAFNLPTGYLNLAEIYRFEGRLEEAEPLYVKALAAAREVIAPEDPQFAIFVNQLAVQLARIGKPGEAEPLFREAIELLQRGEATDLAVLAQSQHDYAGLLRSLGRFEEAEKLYREALAARERVFGAHHPEAAATRTQLANSLFLGSPERHGEALEQIRRALEVLQDTAAYPWETIEAWALQAKLQAGQDQKAAAIASMSRALEIVEKLRPEAGGSDSTRAEHFGGFLDLFQKAAVWQIESGDPGRAVETLERGRARVLLDRLVTARVDLRSGIPREVLEPIEEKEQALKSRIAGLQGRLELAREGSDEVAGQSIAALEQGLDEAARDLQLLSQQIRNASPLWREVLSSDGGTLSIDSLQRTLVPADGMMLVYRVGSESAHVLAVPPHPQPVRAWSLEVAPEMASDLGVGAGPLTAAALDRVLSRTIGLLRSGASPVEEGTARGVRRATSGGPTGGQDLLYALGRTLVPAELWAEIRGRSQLIVLPDGPLHSLPFEALVVTGAGDESSRRYWIDEGPVVRYAQSATSLANLQRLRSQRSADAPRSMLIVADPRFDRGDAAAGPGGEPAAEPSAEAGRSQRGRTLAPLPGTAREAAAIVTALGLGATGEAVVLQGLAADEPGVRSALAGRRDFLHFATHGVVDEGGNELLAGLALTPPAEPAGLDNDGMLQLMEIYELDFDAELAVLSACESHVGREIRGEGVFALSTGFLAAGAQRVVASQWPVDDASTAALMSSFYRHIGEALAAGEAVDYARALHLSRREIRNRPEWSSPYHWAPFILTGLG